MVSGSSGPDCNAAAGQSCVVFVRPSCVRFLPANSCIQYNRVVTNAKHSAGIGSWELAGRSSRAGDAPGDSPAGVGSASMLFHRGPRILFRDPSSCTVNLNNLFLPLIRSPASLSVPQTYLNPANNSANLARSKVGRTAFSHATTMQRCLCPFGDIQQFRPVLTCPRCRCLYSVQLPTPPYLVVYVVRDGVSYSFISLSHIHPEDVCSARKPATFLASATAFWSALFLPFTVNPVKAFCRRS